MKNRTSNNGQVVFTASPPVGSPVLGARIPSQGDGTDSGFGCQHGTLRYTLSARPGAVLWDARPVSDGPSVVSWPACPKRRPASRAGRGFPVGGPCAADDGGLRHRPDPYLAHLRRGGTALPTRCRHLRTGAEPAQRRDGLPVGSAGRATPAWGAHAARQRRRIVSDRRSTGDRLSGVHRLRPECLAALLRAPARALRPRP